MVRDMDLVPNDRIDNRRLEVVADGLPLFGGAQLATDTTLVSALRRDGTARPQADSIDGVALAVARRNKTRTYPELSGGDGRARFVVLAAEVGGRWSEEVRKFLGALATAKARSSPVLLQPSVRADWLHRWRGLLACTAARSFAESLLGNTAPGVDGAVPSMQEVLCDFRHVVSGGIDLSSVFSSRKKILKSRSQRKHQPTPSGPLTLTTS